MKKRNGVSPESRILPEGGGHGDEAAKAGLGEGDPLILLAESRALEHIWELLHNPVAPAIPDGLEGILPLQDIHRELCEIREVMKQYAAWDLDVSPESRGILPGYLKTLQSNLRHVIWRMRMTLEGDMPPQKNSVGEFSGVFDDLIQRMDRALEGLREKEAELREMARDPRQKAEPCDPAVETLSGRDASPEMAVYDELTGALDRESFTFRALIELYAAFAQGMRCCLAVAAPDRFEDFSDRHGRAAGDGALEHAAKVIRAHLWKTDFMGRWDGEEFAIFFQGMDPDVCRDICERILRTLAFTPFNLRGKPAHITASIGITVADPDEFSFPADDAEIIEKLAGRAEQALGEAKRTGRGRVVSSHK
jgi:diguanylate cyclase (GGDEF)-like protein